MGSETRSAFVVIAAASGLLSFSCAAPGSGSTEGDPLAYAFPNLDTIGAWQYSASKVRPVLLLTIEEIPAPFVADKSLVINSEQPGPLARESDAVKANYEFRSSAGHCAVEFICDDSSCEEESSEFAGVMGIAFLRYRNKLTWLSKFRDPVLGFGLHDSGYVCAVERSVNDTIPGAGGPRTRASALRIVCIGADAGAWLQVVDCDDASKLFFRSMRVDESSSTIVVDLDDEFRQRIVTEAFSIVPGAKITAR